MAHALGRLVANYDPEPLAALFDGPVHQRLLTGFRCVEVDHFTLVLGSERPGDTEEIDGFQKRGFALGIGAVVDRHTGRQSNIQVSEVAEIRQSQSGEVSQPVVFLPLDRPGEPDLLVLVHQQLDLRIQFGGRPGVSGGETEAAVDVEFGQL